MAAIGAAITVSVPVARFTILRIARFLFLLAGVFQLLDELVQAVENLALLPAGFKGEPYRSTDGTVFVCVEGKGTTKVGDPTDKDRQRPLLTDAVINANLASIRTTFDKFLDFGDADGEPYRGPGGLLSALYLRTLF